MVGACRLVVAVAGCTLLLLPPPAAAAGAPYLRSVKYQFYHGSNVGWGAAEWERELQAMAAVRVERVTIRNPLDSHWPNYTSVLPLPTEGGPSPPPGCPKLFTAFFTLGGGGALRANPCVRQYSNVSTEQQPLTLLLRAAAKVNISVVLGLAWSGSAPVSISVHRGFSVMQSLLNSVF